MNTKLSNKREQQRHTTKTRKKLNEIYMFQKEWKKKKLILCNVLRVLNINFLRIFAQHTSHMKLLNTVCVCPAMVYICIVAIHVQRVDYSHMLANRHSHAYTCNMHGCIHIPFLLFCSKPSTARHAARVLIIARLAHSTFQIHFEFNFKFRSIVEQYACSTITLCYLQLKAES